MKGTARLLTAMLGVVLLLTVGCGRGGGTAPKAGKVAGCEAALKALSLALEGYSTDNGGLYPPDLQHLVPKYLKALPTCPSVERDTYSASYQAQAKPAGFVLSCSGTNHAADGLGPNLPRYTSADGLVVK